MNRNRRALIVLGIAVAVWLVLRFAWPEPAVVAPVAAAADSISAAERRLARLRQVASTVAGKQAALKEVAGELAGREQAVIQAETAAQAQAQLLAIARRTAKALPQPIDFGSTELGQRVEPLGQDYAEVFVSVNFDCQIEELVNYLAELTAQPEAIGTRDLRIQARGNKEKTIGVRLTLSALAPRSLAPVKRGAL
jgi:hypothetical protein